MSQRHCNTKLIMALGLSLILLALQSVHAASKKETRTSHTLDGYIVDMSGNAGDTIRLDVNTICIEYAKEGPRAHTALSVLPKTAQDDVVNILKVGRQLRSEHNRLQLLLKQNSVYADILRKYELYHWANENDEAREILRGCPELNQQYKAYVKLGEILLNDETLTTVLQRAVWTVTAEINNRRLTEDAIRAAKTDGEKAAAEVDLKFLSPYVQLILDEAEVDKRWMTKEDAFLIRIADSEPSPMLEALLQYMPLENLLLQGANCLRTYRYSAAIAYYREALKRPHSQLLSAYICWQIAFAYHKKSEETIAGRSSSLLYEEEFETEKCPLSKSVSVYPEDGELHVFCKDEAIAYKFGGGRFSNFALSVEIREVAGDDTGAFGILFGVEDLDNFFAILLRSNGQCEIKGLRDDRWNSIARATSKAQRRGNATNWLTLTCVGGRIRVYINGEYAISATVPAKTGQIGIWANPSVHVHFDHLRVYWLNNETFEELFYLSQFLRCLLSIPREDMQKSSEMCEKMDYAKGVFNGSTLLYEPMPKSIDKKQHLADVSALIGGLQYKQATEQPHKASSLSSSKFNLPISLFFLGHSHLAEGNNVQAMEAFSQFLRKASEVELGKREIFEMKTMKQEARLILSRLEADRQ